MNQKYNEQLDWRFALRLHPDPLSSCCLGSFSSHFLSWLTKSTASHQPLRIHIPVFLSAPPSAGLHHLKCWCTRKMAFAVREVTASGLPDFLGLQHHLLSICLLLFSSNLFPSLAPSLPQNILWVGHYLTFCSSTLFSLSPVWEGLHFSHGESLVFLLLWQSVPLQSISSTILSSISIETFPHLLPSLHTKPNTPQT